MRLAMYTHLVQDNSLHGKSGLYLYVQIANNACLKQCWQSKTVLNKGVAEA